MTHLIFCADGVLRLAYDFYDGDGWKEALIPVETVEKANGDRMFIKLIRSTAEIEPGTTLLAFLRALRWWEPVMYMAFSTDLGLYIAEAGRPVATDDLIQMHRIEIVGAVTLEPVVEYDNSEHDPIVEAQATRRWNPTRAIPLDRIALEVSWHANAYETADADIPTGMWDTPLNRFSDTPVILKREIAISDQSQMLRYMTSREPVLNPASPLVKNQPWGKRDGQIAETVADFEPTFLDVVGAMMRQFCAHASPEARDRKAREREARYNRNQALDKQDGLDPEHAPGEGMHFARGAFDALYEDAEKRTELAQEMMAKAREKGDGERIVVRPLTRHDPQR